MAEGNEEETWWGGWLQTAKEKSASALEFVKKDLAEFTCTMQSDTTEVTEQIKGHITQEKAASASTRVRDGMTRFLGGITKVLTIPPDEQDDKSVVISGSVTYDRNKAQLRAVQMDPGTYLDEPPGPKEEFEKWKTTFDLEGTKGDISELLVANVEVRALYTQLVPSGVSHASFWQRYFYRVKQLDEDASRRAALMKRADTSQTEQELAWDDDDWCDADGSPGERASPERRLAAPPPQAQLNASPRNVNQEKSVKPLTDTSQTSTHNIQNEPISDGNKVTDPPENPSLPLSVPAKSVQDGSSQNLDNVINNAIQEIPAEKAQDVSNKSEVEITEAAKEIEVRKEVVPPVSAESQATEEVAVKNEPRKVTNENETDAVHSVKDISTEGDQATIDVISEEIKMRDKGDMVVVGQTTPTSSHSDSSNGNGKETTSLDDDWEKDFDVEVTEEDLRLAQEAAKLLKEKGEQIGEDDDWESWD